MKILNGSLHLSASDVSSAFSCHHRTALDLAVARKERPAPSYFDPMTAALQQRGLEHEKRYVDGLRARGLGVVELAAFGGEQAVAATVDAMKRGVDVIVQAALRRGLWNGRAANAFCRYPELAQRAP